MQRHSATRWLIAGLFLLAFAQAIWIFTGDSKPVLSKVVSVTPLGKHSAVYEVLSDAGNATVPLIYLYFVAEQAGRGDQVLPSLERLTPFLVTRQSGAVEHVAGMKVTTRTQEQVYSYSSTAILKEDGVVVPVRIELTATQE
ncbi:hypothetical protein GCM10011247_21560 [Pseudomonas plecoglossicida]|uniref:Uncharacterized protein n=1 Tax=Pseudomonas plecoglossicida TaxID=70775 RepID=A0AAD0QXH2_PSEDL|nr:hypothetical protein DVB73_13725 [Pseudomonas plecoglossicida]QLB53865.1 hypothetical protein HAV28_03015 [Pseudomonas plecoglossicida]GLR36759.1 hypothetical protein GCM10011247_21560 [Pseudomonas plecoglossicida]